MVPATDHVDPVPQKSNDPRPVRPKRRWEASVCFDVASRFDEPPEAVWGKLVDWVGHGTWVPATHVEMTAGSPTEPGAAFTAFTGVGPLVLEDRMVVTACIWDGDTSSGYCEIEKVGPTLWGRATLRVSPLRTGCQVHWHEDISVPGLPSALGRVLGPLSAIGFRVALRRLARMLRNERRRSTPNR